MAKNIEESTHRTRRSIPRIAYLFFLIVILMVIPLISAFEFDNIKSDLIINKDTSEYGIIEIKNSLFGWEWFQLGKVMSLELKENTELCPSTGCSAKQEIIMYEDGKLIDNVRFIDLKTGAGTSIKSYEIYVNGDLYNGEEVSGYSSGVKYDVELRGKLFPFQEVDWQIKSAGTDWIDDWAVWSWNTGLVSYWNFDESSGDLLDTIGSNDGTVTGALREQPGLLGDAYTFNGSTDYVNFTFKPGALNGTLSFWVNFSGGGNPAIAGHDHGGYNSDFSLKIAGGTEIIDLYMDDGVGSDITIHSNSAIPTNVWVHVLMVWGGNGLKIYVNGTAQTNTSAVTYIPNSTLMIGSKAESTGFGNPFNGSIDETAYWERALTPSEISDLYDYYTLISPMVLNSPIDGYNTTNENITFNCSFDIGYELNISNVSLYHNASGAFILDQTNITLVDTNSTTVIFNALFDTGSYEWNCYGCDNTSSCSWGGENRTFTRKRLVINNETYNTNTLEGSLETFILDVTTADLSITTATLNYNNINYIGSINDLGGYHYEISKRLIIPSVEAEVNNTFYWTLLFEDSSSINTTFHNQTVSNISIDNCLVYTHAIYNFTIIDEEEQEIIPANNSIEILINIYSPLYNHTENTLISNYSGSFNVSSVNICISRNLSNFETTHLLDLTVRYSAQDHETEYYNIDNYNLTNQSKIQNIFLYDLLTSDSTEFQLTFTGSDFLAVEDALVFVMRQYVAENVFKTVELPKTDSNGQTILHLVRNNVIYNFRVMKDGIVIGSFENMIAFCDDVIIGDCKIALNAAEAGEAVFSYDDDLGITYTGPIYDNTTRIITFSFLTTDGSVKTVLMNATRNDIFGNRSICDASVNSSGGTLTCEVPAHVEDSTIITKIFVNGIETLKDYTVLSEFNYGKAGYFIMFIYMLAFILMFSRDKTIMLIGIVVGFITGTSLGLISGRLIGIGASGIWLIIVIILMIWKLNRGRPD